MTFLTLSFLTSLVATLLVLRSAEHHAHHSADHDLSGPQKFHTARCHGSAGLHLPGAAGWSRDGPMTCPASPRLWLLLVSLPRSYRASPKT